MKRPAIDCEREAETVGRTGVEMEALTAVSVALLTIYDMCKAVDRGMVIESVACWKSSAANPGTGKRRTHDMNANNAPNTPFVHDLSPVQLRALREEAARAAGLDAFFQDAMPDGAPGPELVVIPAGIFSLGNPEAERGFGELAPRHVAIERAFAIGRYCVTADEFQRYAEARGHVWPDHLVRTEARQPVTNVTRADATAYLAWLSEQTGQVYRLPTEAEWEYAARAGGASRYCFGDELGCGEANTGSFQIVGRGVAGWRRFLPFCAPMNQALDVAKIAANPPRCGR